MILRFYIGIFFLFLFQINISFGTDKSLTKCNVFLRVGDSRILHDAIADSPKFTPDEKKVLSILRAFDNTSHDCLAISDLKTKKQNYEMIDPYINRQYPGVIVKISADSKFALFEPPTQYKANPYMYDVNLGKLIEIKELHKATQLEFTKNGRWIIAHLENGNIGIYETTSKHFKEYVPSDKKWVQVEIGDSDQFLIINKNSQPQLILTDYEKIKTLDIPIQPESIQTASLNNKSVGLFKYTVQNSDGSNYSQYIYTDLNRNTEIKFTTKSDETIQLLEDGVHSLLIQDTKISIYNIITKEKIEINSQFSGAFQTSTDGNYLLTSNKNGSISIINLVTKKISEFNINSKSKITSFSFLRSNNEIQVQTTEDNKRYIAIVDIISNQIKKWQTPHENYPIFSSDKNKILFYFSDPAYFKGGTITVHDLNENQIQALTSSAKPESYYIKLSTPGSINLKNQLAEVFTFFDKGLHLKNKRLTQKILLNVLSKSTDLYEFIINRFPELGNESFFARRTFDNPTPIWKNAVKKYLNYFIVTKANAHGIVDSMKYLYPIQNYFKNLNYDDVFTFSDFITEALADVAYQTEFKGIFKSMLYKFSEEKVNKLFFSPTKKLTDITFIRKPYEIHPVIFGTQPINDIAKTQNAYGFYDFHLPKISIPKYAKTGDIILKNHKIEWTMNGNPYKAILNIKVVGESLDSVTPKINKIDLNKLTKDKKLTGMIVFGSNLTGEFDSSVKSYKEYFIKNGFTFDKRGSVDSEFKDTFQQQIESGEIDYFIKEAHSDGDERNVFRINKENKIFRATRKTKDGFDEIVYIVIPAKSFDNYTSSRHSVLVSNDEFANWVQKRMKDGHGEFIMFNTSCWSISKAAQEIEKVYNKKFIDISSTTPVSMFENLPDNAEYQLLSDFRAGKTFEEIEMNLKANADNFHGTGNNFTLYQSEDFKKYVLDNAKPALDIDIQLIGPDGKPINIDE